MTIGEVISWIGSLASIISLFLTWRVLRKIRELQEFHIFMNLVPQRLVDIQKYEKELAKLLVDFENSQPNIKLKLGDLRGDLTSLQRVVDESMRPSIQGVIDLIVQYNRSQPSNRQLVENIQAELRSVLREVKNAVEYKRLAK